jgi:hypothetical protein
MDSDRNWARLDIIFLCAVIDGQINPSDEVSSAKFFSVEKLPKMLPSQISIIQEMIKSLQ